MSCMPVQNGEQFQFIMFTQPTNVTFSLLHASFY